MTVDIQPSMGLKDSIEQRRAIMKFRPDPIPEVLLEEIFRLGLRAPSGYNLQPWRIIVVREHQNKEKLQACIYDQTPITQAPIVLICCGDRRVSQPDYVESIVALGQDTAANDSAADVLRTHIAALFAEHPCFESIEAWTNRNTMLAVAQLMIVAKGFGVDSAPLEGFVASQVKAAFRIPDWLDVCCLLCLGYVDEPFKRFEGRLPYQQVCYGESYGQPFEI
jgi:nitroreductase